MKDNLIKEMFNAVKDSQEKLKILDILSNYPEYIFLLKESIEDSNWKVREHTAFILKRDGSQKALEILGNALYNKNFESRHISCKVLGTEEAINVLINDLEYSENSQEKVSAARILGNLMTQRAVEPLIEVLKNKKLRWPERSAAAEALGIIGSQTAIQPLIDVLDDDPQIKLRAAISLGKLKASSGVKALIRKLYDPDWSVRRAAIEALGEIGSSEALNHLEIASHDVYEDVRDEAKIALYKIQH